MADPLSMAASVTALVSAGIITTFSLPKLYNLYQYRDSDLSGTTDRLESLLTIFQSLETALSNRKFQESKGSLIKNIETSIEKCDESIQELQSECDKFQKTTSNGIIAVFKTAGRRATYPFRQSTLVKLEEDIEEIRSNLSSALEVLQLKDNQIIHDDMSDMKLLLDLKEAIKPQRKFVTGSKPLTLLSTTMQHA